jgi:hypothetical protein
MSRAVFLPTPGDPFLVSYWLREFQAWREHTDTLYVHISWPQAPEVTERLRADIEAADGVCVLPPDVVPREHGQALNALLDQCAEDVVFMCEDDLYIHNPELVRAYFERVEAESVVIGRPRGSMSMEIVNALKPAYPSGAALWPYVFARTEDLRSLTEPFGARWWAEGETIKGVNYTCTEACNADTFGAASMEMRGRFPVVVGEPETGRRGGWYHVGSLSSGPATHDYDHVREAAGSWSNRLMWWQKFYDTWPGGLPEQHAAYKEALDRLHATLR